MYVINFIQVQFKGPNDRNGPLSRISADGSLSRYTDYANSSAVQCFPFYSILLAVGQTRVDFFSLDVEGHEFRILKTIPLHKVDIRVQNEIYIQIFIIVPAKN